MIQGSTPPNPTTPSRPHSERILDHRVAVNGSSDTVYMPYTEWKVLTLLKANRQRETMLRKLHMAMEEAAKKKFNERKSTATFFDDILVQLTNNRYTLAQFLGYVFNPVNHLKSNFRWSSFFKN